MEGACTVYIFLKHNADQWYTTKFQHHTHRETLNTPSQSTSLWGACFSCLLAHVFRALHGSALKTTQHGSTRTCWTIIQFCCDPKIRYLNLPHIEHGPIHWHTFRYDLFSIQITPTVKKSNPAGEPHGSPGLHCQAQKGRRTELDWGGGGGGGVFSVSHQHQGQHQD
jgi:hypothetical protein